MLKKTDLLRPLDLDAARAGAPVCFYADGEELKDHTITKAGGLAGYWASDTQENYWAPQGAKGLFRMAPLAWVEDKPVYPGDVLYWLNDPGRMFTVGDRLFENGTIIQGVTRENGIIKYGENDKSGLPPDSLTWNKPKNKRQGYVALFKVGDMEQHVNKTIAYTSHCYASRLDMAEAGVTNGEDFLGVVRVEWEE